jgi:hypothetical protein
MQGGSRSERSGWWVSLTHYRRARVVALLRMTSLPGAMYCNGPPSRIVILSEAGRVACDSSPKSKDLVFTDLVNRPVREFSYTKAAHKMAQWTPNSGTPCGGQTQGPSTPQSRSPANDFAPLGMTFCRRKTWRIQGRPPTESKPHHPRPNHPPFIITGSFHVQ